MKDKCKKYSKDLGCCMMLSDFSQPMPVLQPCIESPCKHYKPYTNFDKITESVETLAFVLSYSTDCASCSAKEGKRCYIEKGTKKCIEQIKEWLQEEIDDENI